MAKSLLDELGEFLITNLRDKSLEQHRMLQAGSLRTAYLQDIQSKLMGMTEEQRKLVALIVKDAIDVAIHDFLFAIQDSHDRKLGVELFVGGKNAAELSDMLHGEIQGNDGWIARFSRFPG